MKRIIAILLCVVCILSLASCKRTQKGSEDKLKIVCTIFPLYDFAKAVAGESAEISMLIDPGTEVHSFDPKPSQIVSVYSCDLFLYIGGESDKWVDSLLKDKEVNSLKMSGQVKLLGEHNHSEHHEHYDEHIWTSPENALLMIDAIAQELSRIDLKNKGVYEKNADAYKAKISALDSDIRQSLSSCNDKFILMADRFPFAYFTEYYGIEYKAAFGGCAVSSDISAKTMFELIKTVNERELKYAYYTEMSNKAIANALSYETGVKLLELHSGHNVTLDDFNSGVTYADIMQRNIIALKEGLGLL